MDLSIEVNGMRFPNPFVIGSGPPSTNAKVIGRCFKAGWGGAVAKTVALDRTEVINVVPRYGKLKDGLGKVYGFENIELISDRPLTVWLDEFKEVKDKWPDRILIASIMEEYKKDNWQEITELVQATGVDGLELNLSCPHGHPEKQMGSAMGQNPDICREVTGWVTEVAKIPVWAKMTPNITDISQPALAAASAGAVGISAINTILSVIGINLKTLRPLPTVEGMSTPGGYSGGAVKPIALRMIKQIKDALPDIEVSGIGGVNTSSDAIEFLLMGASTVQVCTGVMVNGMKIAEELCAGLAAFMQQHGFNSVREVVGKSLPYFTTHHDLVDRLAAAREAKKLARELARSNQDGNWGTDDIEKETAALTTERD